jgi:transposase
MGCAPAGVFEQERLRIENRIEALLFTQGIRKRPSLRSWERDLANLRTGDGREMPRHLIPSP